MKKLIGILLICLLLPALSISAEINTDRRVEWEQDQPTSVILTHWELFWSDTSGGPYVKITDIAKPASPPVGGVYVLDPITLTVSGPPATVVTKYFVMRPVIPSYPGVVDWSNEASSDFMITPGSTYNLRIVVITKPE